MNFARPWLHRLPAPAKSALRFLAHPQRERMYRADWSEFRRDIAPVIDALRRGAPRIQDEALIHSAHGYVPSMKEEALYGAMLRANGIRPVFIASRSAGLDRYLRLIPDARIVCAEEFAVEPTPADLNRANEIVAAARDMKDLIAHDEEGVASGRHALSWFLRKHHLGSVDLVKHRDALAIEIATSLAAIRGATKLLAQERARTLLMNERGYTPFGELYDKALLDGRRVVNWGASHRDDARVFKAYSRETRTEHPYSFSEKTWTDALAAPFSDVDRKRLLDEWEGFYRSKTWFNAQRVQHNTKQLSSSDVIADLHLDPAKPTAVLFAHIFWDATFFYGDGLFDDYRHWLVESVRLANESTTVNWIVKLHPVNVYRFAADGVTGLEYPELTALRDAGVYPAPHVKLLMPETHISSWSLYQLADYCFTIRGTVGFEMAALGKRVVTAGTGYYAHHGFTFDPATRADYEAIVRDPTQLPPMSEAERDRALRFARCLLTRKAFRFDTHRFEYSAAADAVLALNGRARVLSKTADEFLHSETATAWASWLVHSNDADCLQPARSSASVPMASEAIAAR